MTDPDSGRSGSEIDLEETENGLSDAENDLSDAQRALAAFQLADSFLPVGGYTASYGLEQFVEGSEIDVAENLRPLLADYLRGQFGPCDVVALSVAHRASAEGDLDAVLAADRRQHVVTMAAEFRESSTAAGGRLLDLTAEIRGDALIEEYVARVDAGEAPGNYAVATGLVSQREGIPADRARLLAGHAFLVGLLGAAQRLVGISHVRTQAVLTDLRPLLAEVCSDHAEEGIEQMRSFAPRIELMGMAHERAERRLFVS